MNAHTVERLIVRVLAVLLLGSATGCGKFQDFLEAEKLKWKSSVREVEDPLTGQAFFDRYDLIRAKKDLGTGLLDMPVPILRDATLHVTGGWFGGKKPKEDSIGDVALALKEREGAGIAALIATFFLDGAFVRAESEQGSHGDQLFLGAKSLDLRIESSATGVRYLAKEEGSTAWMEIGTSPAVDPTKLRVPTVAVGVIEKGIGLGVDNFSVPANATDPAALSPSLAAALAVSQAKEPIRAAVRALDGVRADDVKGVAAAAAQDALTQLDQASDAAFDAGAPNAVTKKIDKARKKVSKALKQVSKPGDLKQKQVDKALDKLEDACCDLIVASSKLFSTTE